MIKKITNWMDSDKGMAFAWVIIPWNIFVVVLSRLLKTLEMPINPIILLGLYFAGCIFIAFVTQRD